MNKKGGKKWLSGKDSEKKDSVKEGSKSEEVKEM